MKSIPKSGRYMPNKLGYWTLYSLQDVMGKNGVNALLNLANLRSWINAYPSDTLEKHLDFADYSAVNGALEDMYGPRGARGLALRCGRATFDYVLKGMGIFHSAGDLAFKILPAQSKLKFGLTALARILSQISDQHISVMEYPDHFVYTVERCPVCWDRKSEVPSCNLNVGMLQASLKWISGGDEFSVVETKCRSVGDNVCSFVIQKQPLPPRD